MSVEKLQLENKALRRHIKGLEDVLKFEVGEQVFHRTKVAGFNFKCSSCNEKFDIPDELMKCPFCTCDEIEDIMPKPF